MATAAAARRSSVWALLLLLGACCLGALGMRRSGAEGGAVAPGSAEDAACADAGVRLNSEEVAAEVRQGDGLLRLRKAAQRICEGLAGQGALGGKAHATAIFAACKQDGGEPGYRCKGTDSEESANKKMQAPEAIEKKDLALYARVNAKYGSLQWGLEDAAIDGSAPPPLMEAAAILAKHREDMEEREALCRADMDNLKDCGDPLVFFVDLRHLYEELDEAVDSLNGAAAACTSFKGTAMGMSARAIRTVTSNIDYYGRRAIAFTWRNRVNLMAAMVVSKGAQPFIDELVDSGMDKALAVPMAEAFENVVVAMKSIACDMLKEPLLMAEVVSVSARFLGNTMVAATPGAEKEADIQGFPTRKSLPKIFARQVREFGEVLSRNSAVPVASEVLVLFAGSFFEDLAGGICSAMDPAFLASLVKGPKVFAEAKTAAVAPVHAARAFAGAGAVAAGANTAAAGAFASIFDGQAFGRVGREGADEVVAWADALGEHPAQQVAEAMGETKFRRGKRDRIARAAASLAEVPAAGAAALVETSSEGVVDEAAEKMFSALTSGLLSMVKKLPKTPETKELAGALSNVQTALPMFALLAWSAEHVLALMAAPESACEAGSKDCKVPTMKELKENSKKMLSEIEGRALEAISACTNGTKVKVD